MRVVQTIGVPAAPLAADVDAVVVALKSRTIPAAEAIAQSLQALKWLQAQGAEQIYFKYCSTFDSTPEGNIGPVTEALMEALNSDAFYVGALGSRRNQATRKQRLMEHFDLSVEALERLHGPVGLNIGAKTPAEIAVSIIAQIVQVKNAAAAAPVATESSCVKA